MIVCRWIDPEDVKPLCFRADVIIVDSKLENLIANDILYIFIITPFDYIERD